MIFLFFTCVIENFPYLTFTPQAYGLAAYMILCFFKDPMLCIALFYENVMLK